MILNSFILDRIIRLRVIGTHVDYHYVREAPILPLFHFEKHPKIALIALILNAASVVFSPEWTHIKKYMNILFNSWKNLWCLTDKKRTEARVNAEIIIAALEAISVNDLLEIFKECDYPIDTITTNFAPTGFWRVDKDKDPELRHTVLTLVAFHDLEEKIRACGGDREKGIEAFLNQNDGQGWMLPETLRLADYGLGHDERARRPQPVASRLGPRFYDWQLAQTAEE